MTADVAFEVLTRGNGTLCIRTNGMRRRGRPELEVTEVGPQQVDVARALLDQIATTVARRPVTSGQRMQLDGGVAVELHESEHVPAGFFARALGASDRMVMRVTDAGAPTAQAALCGTARTRARRLAGTGDVTGAARVLHEALEAAASDDEAVTGERASASIELSRIESDPHRAFDHLLCGLRLAPATQLAELGGTFTDIARFDRRSTNDEMRRIAAINLGLVDGLSEGESALRVVPSPIWERSEDGHRAEFVMTMLPHRWLRLYWAGSVRDELERGLIPEMAARIFALVAGTDEGVARLSFVTRASRATFPAAPGAKRATAMLEPEPHIILASAVLAHVARLRAGGLTLAEIDAAFGLEHDEECKAIARDKERRLRVRLAMLGGSRVA